jgi:hypothetical protein
MPTEETKRTVKKMLTKAMKEYESWYRKWLKSEAKE